MCLLCYLPPEAEINPQDLEVSAINNPDGFGYSLLKSNGQLITHRGLDSDRVISQFLKERKADPRSHALWHARLATAGAVTKENCHPFRVPNVGAVLGHNGHLSNVYLSPKETRSDSRVFVEDLFSKRFEALDDPERFEKLEKFASGSKFVILSNDKRLRQPAYIVNEDLGYWVDGVWFSNSSYKPYTFRNPLSSFDYYTDELEHLCQVCGADETESDSYWLAGFCSVCLACVDCLGVVDFSCLCYRNEYHFESLGYYGTL